MITLPYDDPYANVDQSQLMSAVGTPQVSAPAANYSPYLTAGGAGFSAYSQYAAGQGSASLLRANADIAGMQARGENQAGAEQAELYRQHLNQTMGKQAAQIGGSGVTMSGSALRTLSTTAELGARDISQIQTNAARKAWGFSVTQVGDEARASMASAAGTNAAIGGLITSGARAYGNWSNG